MADTNSEDSTPDVEINIDTESENPVAESDSSPDVVVVSTDSGSESDAVEAATVTAAVEQAGDLARLEMVVVQQAETIDALAQQVALLTESQQAASEAASMALVAAEQAAEGPAPEPEADDSPEREHWWFRNRKR